MSLLQQKKNSSSLLEQGYPPTISKKWQNYSSKGSLNFWKKLTSPPSLKNSKLKKKGCFKFLEAADLPTFLKKFQTQAERSLNI